MRSLTLVVFCAGLVLSRPAGAQEAETATRSAARALGTSGVEAYQDGRYEQASDELEKAYSILRVPTLGLWSARALVKRRMLVQAAERYLETSGLQVPTGDTVIQKKAIEEAKTELAALRPTIPTLKVRVIGATLSEVQVSIDGAPVAAAPLSSARLVNPGSHEVLGVRGAQRTRASVTLGEGQQQELELRFDATGPAKVSTSAPSQAPAPVTTVTPEPATDAGPTTSAKSSRRTWALVGMVAGGAGLVVGGVTGGLAMSKRQELLETGKCDGGCDPSLEGDVNQLATYRTVSTIGFIAGGVLAATGVVLWVSAPRAGGAQASASVGASGLQLAGRF